MCDALVPITDRVDRVYCDQRCADAGTRARRYGLSIPEFRELVSRHGETCAICGQESDKLHIDHCHATGKVRGMLCPMCNLGIGYFSDDTERLLKAVAYLSENNTPG